jgi:LysM repeat protein
MRLSFLTSVLLAFALTATVVAVGFYSGILPAPRGSNGGTASPRPSGFAAATPTPSPTPILTAEPTEASPSVQPTPGGTYVVQEGDFLSGIGEKFGIPWQLIAEANGIEGPDYTIQVGQVLVIPAAGPEPSGGPDGDTYIVKPGDSVIGIAEELGIDPTDLADFNNLADWNSIQPGQVLYIPGPGWTPRPLETPDT